VRKAAGYVTRDSVVEGNLCINDGGSPGMGRYEGGSFLGTYRKSSRRKERDLLGASRQLSRLLNRADIQGARRIFRENQIYAESSSL
jgi:hypothetical protein